MSVRKELYQFTHGTKVWNFTSGVRTVTFADVTYLPIPGLSRTAIEDEDINKCEIEVSLPHPYQLLNAENNEFTQVFLNKIYFESVRLTLLELIDNETLVLFKGRVTQPKFDDDSKQMTLICSTAESYQNRNILTRKFQRSCASKIYDRFCGLKFEEWAVSVTVTSVDGLSVFFTVNPTQVKDAEGKLVFEPDVPVLDEFGEPVLDENNDPVMQQGAPVMEVKSYPAGYFNRGLLKKDGVFTFVQAHANRSINLYRQHISLKIGDIVQLAPGCDQSLKLCESTFKNGVRYHGFPNMPSENPINNMIVR